jgi:hypothetical protein
VAWFLRKIRFNRWGGVAGRHYALNEVPAEPIGDLLPQDGGISLWRIEDDGHNLDRIIANLAAVQSALAGIDFAQVDEHLLVAAGFTPQKTDGRSPDRHADGRWHYDLLRPMAIDVVKLAQLLLEYAEFGERTSDEVLDLLTKATQAQQIPHARLPNKIKSAVPVPK